MKAFRIGRKATGPWVNMRPPIRGGVFRSMSATPDAVSEKCGDNVSVDSVSDGESTQDSGSEDAVAEEQRAYLSLAREPSTLRNRSPQPVAVTIDQTQLDEKHARDGKDMSPESFVKWVMEQDIDDAERQYPSVDVAVQQEIITKYRELHQQVIDQGLYQCRYIEYGKEMTRYTTLFVLFLVALHYGWYTTSAAFLGVFWHQIMFSAHDAGHRAISGNFVIDSCIGVFIADFCCGLSIGWWKSSHNVHHIITNHPEHDPDIQNVPLFATSPHFFKSIVSTYYNGFVFVWDSACAFLVPYQKYSYYPVMAVARFNLYVLSWLHVMSNKSSGLGGSKAWWIRPMEIIGMAFYWFWFGYLLVWCSIPDWTNRVIFVLVSHIVLMPLHVQINLSHWGMSTSELAETESFPQRQMRTTMDVDCPKWLDFFHGGLQFQAIHHLFPRMPRHNLRRAQALVKEFCRETQIPYSILTFLDGNKKVLGRLSDVGDQVKILASCQQHLAETKNYDLH